MTCGSCEGIESFFGARAARRDLERYRKRGPRKETRVLVQALKAEGVEEAALLDIGGGVGAVQHELLAAGASRATSVDASPAYVDAAIAESERRGHADRICHYQGDFVALATDVDPGDVVTLDKVVCCYPDMHALVALSAERARKLYGLVYPRDALWVRAGAQLVNLALRVARSAFRVYIHRPDAIDAAVRDGGFERRFVRDGLIWRVVVYARTHPAR